jgi:hypothetical protein
MYSRWLNFAVIALWLATMSWLVTEKILPPLLIGQPPSYETIVRARKKNPVVGWKMLLDGRELGWALSEAKTLEKDLTEIHSQVHFDRLPLRELIPSWLRVLLPPIGNYPLGDNLRMNTQSTLTIDPLRRLTGFSSTVKIDPLKGAITMHGTVDGTQLKVTINSSEFSHSTEAYLPKDALVVDAFSPLAQLPGLHEGQTWTVPVYSPLRPPGKPIDSLSMDPVRLVGGHLGKSSVGRGRHGHSAENWLQGLQTYGILSDTHPVGVSRPPPACPRRLIICRHGLVLPGIPCKLSGLAVTE